MIRLAELERRGVPVRRGSSWTRARLGAWWSTVSIDAAIGFVVLVVLWAVGVALIGEPVEPSELPPPVYVVEQPVATGGGRP